MTTNYATAEPPVPKYRRMCLANNNHDVITGYNVITKPLFSITVNYDLIKQSMLIFIRIKQLKFIIKSDIFLITRYRV